MSKVKFMGIPEISHKVFIMVEEASCTTCQSPYTSIVGCVKCAPVKALIYNYIEEPEDAEASCRRCGDYTDPDWYCSEGFCPECCQADTDEETCQGVTL